MSATAKIDIDQIAADMKLLRQDLHRNPQTAFEETYIQGVITAKLKEWGIPFETGIAGTGTVAIITGKGNASGKSIGLRADIDALDIIEKSTHDHVSNIKGKMHGCGHDGHTATMLGAIQYLAQTRNFDGTVYVIFQPAEELGEGADAMIAAGLFDKYPIDEVYGYHNWPGLKLGQCGTAPGPLMAAVDGAIIELRGKGGHGAMPHNCVDPIACGAHLVSALQTIVSRNVDPIDNAVISVTNFNGGTGADNVIPESATLVATVRSFKPETRDMLEARIKQMAEQIAAAFGCTSDVKYDRGCDPVINWPDQTNKAVTAARLVYGNDNVNGKLAPWMGAEDFGAMLKAKPGNYILLGQATDDPNSPHNQGLHADTYDYNDALLPYAIRYFSTLVETVLPIEQA